MPAWLPQEGVQREFYVRPVEGGLFQMGVILPLGAVAPGEAKEGSVRLYAGPQTQSVLGSLAPGFDLVVDYGWLTVIAAPLFWVLSWLHKLTGNWGWAIVLVTVLLKAIFFPLSAASYRSMAKMRALTPRLQRLKELYGDDKARMHAPLFLIDAHIDAIKAMVRDNIKTDAHPVGRVLVMELEAKTGEHLAGL